MTLRSVLSLTVGLDTVVLGPPSAFGGRPDGGQIGRPGVHGREDAQRWVSRLCQDPAARIRIRQQLIHWTGDPHHLNQLSHNELANMRVDLCARGHLSMWASRPLGGQDAQALARVPRPDSAPGPVDARSFASRIEPVLFRVGNYVEGMARLEYEKLLAPDALKTAVNVMAMWTSRQTAGSSEIMDVLLQVLANRRIDRSAREVADRMTDVLAAIARATQEADLDTAARKLAVIITILHVDGFAAMLLFALGKAGKGAMKTRRRLATA